MSFVPSLELSRLLYEQEIAPFLAAKYPGLRYAAASSGMCSECLGLDDEVSMDHMWGPRVALYLSTEDHQRCGAQVLETLRAALPMTFEGLAMSWLQPGVDVQDTREKALYSIWVTTVDSALRFCGGTSALPLQDDAWLRVSEQRLLEFTNGIVFRDDLGDLTRARAALAYYPDSVLRFLLMCGWSALGGDWFPIGRIGSRGDDLGLRIQATREAEHLMRLGFMVSRKYHTYKKWFGSLFARLPIAAELAPTLRALLREERWQAVEERIWEGAAIVLRYQNALGIAPAIRREASLATDGRHHLACDYWGIGAETAGQLTPRLQALRDNELFWLHDKQLILWNGETGKWTQFLQKGDA